MLLGVVMGLGLAASITAGHRLLGASPPARRPGRPVTDPALHAMIATLPHLRRGLAAPHAAHAAPHLRRMVGADALALADHDRLLAYTGAGAGHHRPGDDAAPFGAGDRHDGVQERRGACLRHGSPLASVLVAPLHVEGEHVGSLIAGYRAGRRPRPRDTRAVEEAAALVSALLELSELDREHERLAQAELRALRAQISPHFIYNALAAVARAIHTSPDQARELLAEFAEFTRYAFRGERPYVPLADELRYIETYLRLERARFGDRLNVEVDVAPEVLGVAVPALSLQPLVENAVRHGLDGTRGERHIEILGRDLGADVELRVRDDGPGMDPGRAGDALAGRAGGIGLANVQGRLRRAFGEAYGLAIEPGEDGGTVVTMLLPKLWPGMRAA